MPNCSAACKSTRSKPAQRRAIIFTPNCDGSFIKVISNISEISLKQNQMDWFQRPFKCYDEILSSCSFFLVSVACSGLMETLKHISTLAFTTYTNCQKSWSVWHHRDVESHRRFGKWNIEGNNFDENILWFAANVLKSLRSKSFNRFHTQEKKHHTLANMKTWKYCPNLTLTPWHLSWEGPQKTWHLRSRWRMCKLHRSLLQASPCPRLAGVRLSRNPWVDLKNETRWRHLSVSNPKDWEFLPSFFQNKPKLS